MNKNFSFNDAVELFSSPKKTLKALDKTFSKESYEFILKAQDKNSFAVYSSGEKEPICVVDDTLKAFMGVLYFEFGVGKQDLLPSWAMPEGAVEDNWNKINSELEVNTTDMFSNLNAALNNGSTLYCSNLSNDKNHSFLLTNPFNENFADRIVINSKNFSDGLIESNSIAGLCLSSCEENCQ